MVVVVHMMSVCMCFKGCMRRFCQGMPCWDATMTVFRIISIILTFVKLSLFWLVCLLLTKLMSWCLIPWSNECMCMCESVCKLYLVVCAGGGVVCLLVLAWFVVELLSHIFTREIYRIFMWLYYLSDYCNSAFKYCHMLAQNTKAARTANTVSHIKLARTLFCKWCVVKYAPTHTWIRDVSICLTVCSPSD